MQAQTFSQPAFDVSAGLKSYVETMELWRKGYESMLRGIAGGGAAGVDIPAQFAGADQSAAWQKPLEVLFQQFLSQQVELCRFFNQRFEEYAGLPARAGQCKTLAEIHQIQAAFFSKMISDYADEMQRLGNPFAANMANWTQQAVSKQAPAPMTHSSEVKH
jgi:hypothetical protein